MIQINNFHEAKAELLQIIQSRGSKIEKTEDLTLRNVFGNIRYFTNRSEVFHLKFSKKLFQPRETVVGGAADLDKKLKFAIMHFGSGETTLNGINEDLLLDLIEIETKGFQTYFVTVMADGRVLWRTAREVYEFVQRYDTIIHFPKAFEQPVCFVPTGWLINKSNIVSAPPKLA
jgi:hypothetical protein